MMADRRVDQAALSYEFSLERHVPADYLIRAVDWFVDLESLRAHVALCLRSQAPLLSQNAGAEVNRDPRRHQELRPPQAHSGVGSATPTRSLRRLPPPQLPITFANSPNLFRQRVWQWREGGPAALAGVDQRSMAAF